MEENITKTSFTKNLAKMTFTSTVAMNVDANANIKNLLDVESYLYDVKTDCGSGKAVVSGKIAVKVLYIDTDNMSNTIMESQPFTETITDGSITSDVVVNAENYTVVNSVVNGDGTLKISCDVSINPIIYLNIPLTTNLANFENLIVKKSEISTCVIRDFVDTSFNYSVNFETKDDIAKILMYNAHISPTSVEAEAGKVVVEGKLFGTLIYETTGENGEIKQLSDVFNFKTSFEANVDQGNLLDLCFNLDRSKESINTATEDDGVVITVGHNIKAKGVALKTVVVDVVDDIYSVENEVELTLNKREYCRNQVCTRIDETVSGDVEISDEDTAIEKVVANLNICPEITNKYIKDGMLVIEGIVSSCVIYLDENREYKQKQTTLPFIINTKIKLENADLARVSICFVDSRVKSKRGTIIELDYSIKVCVCYRELEAREMLENFTLGKPLSLGDFDYQIYVAKPNETSWDLCKRIKVLPENLSELNPNLPLEMVGGEKIIIKR